MPWDTIVQTLKQIVQIAMDQLSYIIDSFSLQAGVFYTGKLCGLTHFNDDAMLEGHIHLLRSGKITLIDQGSEPIVIDRPSVIFFPRPSQHSIRAQEIDDAELICATVTYGTGNSNSLANALPKFLVLPIEQMPFLQTNIEWLLDESNGDGQGKQAIMNRLMEVFIINMLRSIIESKQIGHSMLAGLTHPQLKRVLHEIHNAPEYPWSLEKLAEIAAMSRSKFAEVFKSVIGQTTNDYISEWRISIAQSQLLQGKSVSIVANNVGYETASALSRVFRKKIGLAPKEWLKHNQGK